MKRIYISLILLVFVFASCDVLDPEPQTSLDAETVLSNGAAAEAVLLGAYSRMQVGSYYGVEYVLNPGLIADNTIFQGFFDSQLELDQRSVPYTNLWISTAWVNIYRVINISNLLITEVPNIDDDAFATRDRVLGEAHAIRALAYFDLLRVFGEHFDTSSPYGIPLLLEPVPDNDFNQIPDLARSSVEATYQQILDDLGVAETLLAGFADRGKMNYWATLALSARVHLYARNYSEAFTYANDVIENGPMSLVASIEELYGPDVTGFVSESIFDLEFNDQDQSSLNTFTRVRDEYNADPDLVDAFHEDDARGELFDQFGVRFKTNKYLNSDNANNVRVLRLAEMYLIRSEAAVYSTATPDPNAGLADLNVIRNRAGLGDLDPFNSLDEYVDALLLERRLEFNFEGHRFFDLVRFDKINEVLGMPDHRKVFPIPRNELLVSENLEQNPQYPTP